MICFVVQVVPGYLCEQLRYVRPRLARGLKQFSVHLKAEMWIFGYGSLTLFVNFGSFLKENFHLQNNCKIIISDNSLTS